jgi:mRNA interferase MazF
MPDILARGDVRLYQTRPVVVLTRDSAIPYLASITVAPVTSIVRGVPSEVVLNEEDGMDARCVVNLHHPMTVSRQKLGKRIAQLDSARMHEIGAALWFAVGSNGR